MSKIMIRVLIIIAVLVLLIFWFSRPPRRSGLENGTRVTLTSGDYVLHATLNSTKAAESLRSKLPMSISLGRSSLDYCGTAPALESDSSERQYGWRNGDISIVGGWISIFYVVQHRLPMPVMVLGSIDESDLHVLKKLDNSVSFRIEIAE